MKLVLDLTECYRKSDESKCKHTTEGFMFMTTNNMCLHASRQCYNKIQLYCSGIYCRNLQGKHGQISALMNHVLWNVLRCIANKCTLMSCNNCVIVHTPWP